MIYVVVALSGLFRLVTSEDRVVILTTDFPSYSEHSHDFRETMQLTVHASDCAGNCSFLVSVGIHTSTDTNNQGSCQCNDNFIFPLYIDDKEQHPDHINWLNRKSPMQYCFYMVNAVRENATIRLTLPVKHCDCLFAYSVFREDVVKYDNAPVVGVEDFSGFELKYAIIYWGWDTTYGHYLTLVAPRGKHIYTPELYIGNGTIDQCRYDAFAGPIPSPDKRDQRKVFDVPRYDDLAVNLLWRMSTVTFWLHGGTCFGTLTYQQKEGNDETQNEIVAAPAIFGDMSVDYPEHSAERINRTYTLTDDLPDAPQLMIEIRDLEGGILIIRLNDSNSEQTKEFQITENGPFLLCLQADELMHTWTPKSKNSSRFSVLYRLTSFDVSLPECFIEPTRPVEEIEETRESFKLFYIFIPIAIVVFLSQLIFYTYQLCNEKQGSQIEYIRSVDPWEIDSLQLTISNRIGRGGFSDVYYGEYRGTLPCLLANRDLEKHFSSNQTFVKVAVKKPATPQDVANFLQEIFTMKSIGFHPYLLSILGCSSSLDNPSILTEFCAFGNLHTQLVSIKRTDHQIATNVIFVEDLYRIAWEVASALEFLSSKNLLHRDVAARNVLLTLQKTSKLSDFGLSRSSNKALYTSHGGCLPIKWTALEAIEFGIFTEKADVWSFGVLLWEMFSFGDTPYEDLEPSRLLGELKKGFRLIPPHRTPTQISEVMTSCWKTRLTNRPTFQVITQKLSSFNESQLLTKGC